jgi:hypothetical protein
MVAAGARWSLAQPLWGERGLCGHRGARSRAEGATRAGVGSEPDRREPRRSPRAARGELGGAAAHSAPCWRHGRRGGQENPRVPSLKCRQATMCKVTSESPQHVHFPGLAILVVQQSVDVFLHPAWVAPQHRFNPHIKRGSPGSV